MQLITPLELSALAPSKPSQWLPTADEQGCRLRALRLASDAAAFGHAICDTIVFAAKGSLAVTVGGQENSVAEEGLLFLPAGTTGLVRGSTDSVILEVLVPIADQPQGRTPKFTQVDESRFEGQGFAYQSLLDRSAGSSGVRVNILRVASGAGSPGYHIHAFDQIYFLLEGEMVIDIGVERYSARAPSIVYLPAGVVHRNFNKGPGVERHITFLVPEPPAGAIFDYAVTIHNREAEMQTSLPAPGPQDEALPRKA